MRHGSAAHPAERAVVRRWTGGERRVGARSRHELRRTRARTAVVYAGGESWPLHHHERGGAAPPADPRAHGAAHGLRGGRVTRSDATSVGPAAAAGDVVASAVICRTVPRWSKAGSLPSLAEEGMTSMGVSDPNEGAPPGSLDPIWGHWHRRAMAELKIRSLDEQVASALRTRARADGTSLEEAARRALAESVEQRRSAFARRAAACRAASREARRRKPSDSATTIRRERDAWG
jgi:plasmid stability protein